MTYLPLVHFFSWFWTLVKTTQSYQKCPWFKPLKDMSDFSPLPLRRFAVLFIVCLLPVDLYTNNRSGLCLSHLHLNFVAFWDYSITSASSVRLQASILKVEINIWYKKAAKPLWLNRRGMKLACAAPSTLVIFFPREECNLQGEGDHFPHMCLPLRSYLNLCMTFVDIQGNVCSNNNNFTSLEISLLLGSKLKLTRVLINIRNLCHMLFSPQSTQMQ